MVYLIPWGYLTLLTIVVKVSILFLGLPFLEDIFQEFLPSALLCGILLSMGSSEILETITFPVQSVTHLAAIVHLWLIQSCPAVSAEYVPESLVRRQFCLWISLVKGNSFLLDILTLVSASSSFDSVLSFSLLLPFLGFWFS